MTNRLQTLSGVCTSQVLDVKWLLAPSHRASHQWVETLVRSGQPVVNLHATTLLGLGLNLVGSELAAAGLALASGELGPLIVATAWSNLDPEGYLGRLAPSEELSAAVYESLLSLRLAECIATALNATHLESSAKAKDICQLLNAYEAFLTEHALVDAADVFRMAAMQLQTHSSTLDPTSIVLVPEGLSLSGLERRFLDACPAKQRLLIEHPVLAASAGPRKSDVSLLAHVPDAVHPVQAQHDGSVQFFRAVGEINEIREVLRRCLAEQLSLDEVEILHTDTSTYAELIYTTAKRYFSDVERPNGVPVTFAEGISASASRPGRALTIWLQWIDEGFPQRLLVEMIGEGLLNFVDDDDLSFNHLAQLLRTIEIGLDAANYLPKLDVQIKALRSPSSGEAEKNEEEPAARAIRERKLKGLATLRKLISKLLNLSHSIEEGTAAASMAVAAEFLTSIARSVSELDRYATESLLEQIQDRQLWLERLELKLNLRSWLISLPSQTRVLGSGPRPGHLHVAHISSGGQSSRRRTFIVGLDDRRFPGAALQDPILLDKERASLGAELPTSAGRLRKQIEHLALTLSRLPECVTLSWSCHDLADDREAFPSSFALTTFRLISGQRDADLASLNRSVGPPISFAPTIPIKALDETERWLWRLSEHDVIGTNQTSQVEWRFPHLARGYEASRERARGFGPFNGLVPLAGAELNPFAKDTAVLSASALETAGRCPRAFFFRNALQLRPPDEVDVDPDCWLDAAQFGQLLHEVFRRFMTELTQAGQRPLFERDHLRLAAILQDCVAHWRSEVPPANENAFRTQYWRLIRSAKLFLQAEEEFCKNSHPRYFEVALGMGSGDGTGLDCKDPIAVSVNSGQSIQIRGQIDRVDQTGDHRFTVWDYKVGSGYGYDQNDPFRQGRRVQSLLYLRMIETALRARHDPKATVEGFGYFFPSVRTFGSRFYWEAATLEAGTSILNSVCSLIREGAFPATNQADDCRFCDFQSICGDGHRVARESQGLLDRNDLISLRHFRELRCD